MRSKIIITTTALAILLLIPLFTTAQPTVGCCCDPVLHNGSYMTASDCASISFIFVGPPPSIGVTCSQHCNATLAPTPGGVCGDLICQSTETTTSCPADCAPIVIGCGSPTYKPAPTALLVKPVKSQKAIQVSFSLPCAADYLNISRCKGTDCTNFQPIALIPPMTVFKDEDPILEFNTDYTYSVVAHYSIAGDSDPAIATGNAGDIECWQQKEDKFCISYFSYDQYYEYLSTYGYAQSNSTRFATQFGIAINQTFATRFNKAWQCNDNNLLVAPSPQVECDPKLKQFCIADENGPRCITREPCNIGFDPFGLLATQTTCETGLLSRYCFFDRSTTTVNKCYGCDPRMTCYDYKSKTACAKDNCGAGDCQWNNVFEDLGIGVCIDKRYNNCKLCNTTGTPNMENTNATSIVWDACREERSSALSNTLYPCFFDLDKKTSKTCDEATCADYTALQCGAPSGGIKLNPDNSIAIPSTDTCQIGVCEYTLQTGCVKNADGNTGAGFQDCMYGNKTCEQDHFPPTTTLMPTGFAGRVDFINIRIFDKKTTSTPPLDFAGKTGYKTYLCVKNATSTCNDARNFPIATIQTKLSLKNTVLKEGNRTVGKLSVGNNTIYFYSRDSANNLELVQSTTVYACDNCSAPKLVNFTVTGGRVIGNKVYTSATKPTFTFTFDEPTQVTFAEISRPGESIQLQQLTTGMVETHEFTPIATINGTYNFTLNGHNEKNIYFDPPGLQYELIVDPELAGLTIAPEDGSILNKTQIDIVLNFTRPVTLTRIQLVSEAFTDPYVPVETSKNITALFTTTNNHTFTAKPGNITGGKYTVIVEAQGFNALSLYKQSSFFIATQPPGIRLLNPTFGVTPYSIFNITVETPIPSECAYVFDTPTAPASTDFEFFNPMDGTGTIHNATGPSIPYGSTEEHPLHVYCTFDQFGIKQRTFNLTLDPEPPKIISAFAEPAIIAERYIPDQDLFVTTLKAQIDKPGFCKYSQVTSSFAAMDGRFPGYDRTPKTSMGADVNVTQPKIYQYWITCKGKNQLTSQPAQVNFTVDLTLPLSVKSSTPQGFGTLNFTIGVVANKRVYCYFGEQPDDTTKPMGTGSSSYTQWQQIKVDSAGEYTYYVKCAHVSGEQSDVIEIPVIVDTTPPEMKTVDDTGLPDDPEITWSKTRIKVSTTAEDPESGISYFLITLREFTGNRVIVKDYVSNITTGEPIFISTTQNGTPFLLSNDKQYKFVVKAVNKVGLQSEPLESNGVTVDITRTPEPCFDGERNQNETDIDCGGPCDGCSENKKCDVDLDCATNYCQEGTCKVARCDDGAINGLESDVDCGGEPCLKCKNEQVCINHDNCDSGYCDIKISVCAEAPPCFDKILTPEGGETDIDCGGSCERCKEGKNCAENTDCEEPLRCRPDTKVCTSEPIGDDDLDGVSDDIDECLGTPPDETVNEKGCGPSQTYSLGDEINDRWRMDNFGCIECPEATADSDPDKDGLTNLQEFQTGTIPTKKDTDGDGWKDGKEVEKGTDPTNPESHPPSIFKGFLYFLFVMLAIGGIATGVYLALQAQKEKRKPTAVPKAEARPAVEAKKADEVEKLRTFAKKEEIPQKEWISLEKEIKKKPLTPKKFSEALEKLKKIAHKEKIRPEEPLQRLREMLEDIEDEELKDLLAKYKKFTAGLLTKEEIEELFKRLKITSEYYKEHKEEFEKELEGYGRKKKKH